MGYSYALPVGSKPGDISNIYLPFDETEHWSSEMPVGLFVPEEVGKDKSIALTTSQSSSNSYTYVTIKPASRCKAPYLLIDILALLNIEYNRLRLGFVRRIALQRIDRQNATGTN